MDLATFVARARRPYLSTESNQSKHKMCFSLQKNVCNNQSDLISINQTHQLRFSLRNRKQNVSSLSHRGSDFYSLAQRSTVSPFLTIVVGNFRRCGRLIPRSFSSDKCGHSVLEPNSSRANRVERVRLMLVPEKFGTCCAVAMVSYESVVAHPSSFGICIPTTQPGRATHHTLPLLFLSSVLLPVNRPYLEPVGYQ